MNIAIKHRGDTAANWTSANPIPLAREICIETDSYTDSGGFLYYKFKLGDGVTAWNSLKYFRLAGIGGGGSTTFIGLTDVPASFSGQGSKYVKVNETADGLEFEPIEAADLPTGIDVAKLADGSISNTEFQYLNNVTSNIQTQIDGKQPSLGYTAENQANKENTTLDTSTTKYPTNRLVKERVDLKQDSATALQLGETSSTAYRGDRGKSAYDYSTVGHLPLAGGNLSGAVNETTGPTVNSAATVDLTSTNAGNYYTIQGNTGPITSFGSIQAGTRRHLRFTGTPTITHHATSMILPTGASIVVAAGDTATFMSLGGGNWVCLHYSRATGAALVSGSGITVASTTITSGTDTYVAYNNAGVYGESSLLQVITSISRVVASNVLLQSGEVYGYKFYSRNAPNYWDMDGGSSVLHTDGGGAHASFLDTGCLIGDAAYSTRDASAVLQIDSITRGFLPPRMTTTQRNAISSPAAGLIIYNTTDTKHQGYNGSWFDLY